MEEARDHQDQAMEEARDHQDQAMETMTKIPVRSFCNCGGVQSLESYLVYLVRTEQGDNEEGFISNESVFRSTRV